VFSQEVNDSEVIELFRKHGIPIHDKGEANRFVITVATSAVVLGTILDESRHMSGGYNGGTRKGKHDITPAIRASFLTAITKLEQRQGKRLPELMTDKDPYCPVESDQ
jgi:hypothetical protein